MKSLDEMFESEMDTVEWVERGEVEYGVGAHNFIIHTECDYFGSRSYESEYDIHIVITVDGDVVAGPVSAELYDSLEAEVSDKIKMFGYDKAADAELDYEAERADYLYDQWKDRQMEEGY